MASKQNIKSRATLRSIQEVIFNRAARRDAYNQSEVSQDTGNADNEESGIILLGVHLCGLLSLRAIDMFNANTSRMELFALKPCCLPNTSHIKNSITFAVGRHVIPCVEVCAAGKWVGNAVDGAWCGPPRNHLVGRFRAWTSHLNRGIDVCCECNGSTEGPPGEVSEEATSHVNDSSATSGGSGGALRTALDLRTGDVRMGGHDEEEGAGETSMTDVHPEHTASLPRSSGSCRVLEEKSCQWGRKSIEEFRVQEIGYQNVYIFAEQHV